MYEWSLVAEGDAVSEISCVNGVMRKERIIIIIIIITRMLLLQATVKVISGTEYVTLSRTDFHVTYTFPGSVLLARAFGIRMRSPATLLLAE